MRRLVAAACIGVALLSTAGPALAQNAGEPRPADPVKTAEVAATQAAASAKAAEASAKTATDAAAKVAEAPPGAAGLGEDSVKAILKLFVLAVVLESALALLFNWRPFVVIFDGRGVKSLVSFAASLVLVFGFKVDVIGDLMKAYTGSAQSNLFSYIITAMVVAGGGSGVNNLLRSLGLRPVNRIEDITPKPPPNEAWLSVAIVDRKILAKPTPVWIEIMEEGQPYRVAGVVRDTSNPNPVLRFFLRDQGRLPPSGGIALKPDTPYQVRVSGRKPDGTTYVSSEVWGPFSFRAGAIVDIDFRV
jgi:hypothetical protein